MSFKKSFTELDFFSQMKWHGYKGVVLQKIS